MSFSVILSKKFKKEVKRLFKKYPLLKKELVELNDTLEFKPETGTALGNDTYKIRLAIKSKGKDKSGGGRVVTYVLKCNKEVYLLTIYDNRNLRTLTTKPLRIASTPYNYATKSNANGAIIKKSNR